MVDHPLRPSESFDASQQQDAHAHLHELSTIKAIVDSLAQGVFVIDCSGVMTFINPSAERMLGWTSAELLGRNMHDTVHYKHADGTPLPAAECKNLRVLETGVTIKNDEDVFIRKDGSIFPTVYTASPILNEDRLIVGVVVAFEDITEPKRAGEERRLRDRALASTTEGILITDASQEDNPIIYANHGFERLTGYTLQEIAGRNCRFMQGADTDRVTIESIRSAISEGRPCAVELLNYRKDGSAFWNALSISPVRDARGSVTHFIGVQQDVTERLRMEERLIQIGRAVEGTSDAIGMSDVDGCSIYHNRAFVELFGYTVEELNEIGGASAVYKDQAVAQELFETLINGRSWSGEVEIRSKDGRIIPVALSGDAIRGERGELLGLIGICTDITKQRQMEQQLQQSQKMEAVGRLAGGVAHDFNNLLTAISGYSELSLRRLKPEDQLYRNIGEIKRAAGRAASLTNQLLAFSRKQVLQPRVLNLNVIISDVEKMLRRLIGENIELLTNLDPSLGHVKADPGQVEQVIMNLAINAKDAMPQDGKLMFETSNIDLDDEYASLHVGVTPGRYVLFALSDTGTGMDERTLEKIFEPFFTTKETGKGTGLGLSTVHGIINQSDGHIRVYSEVGWGTTFKIYLPRVDAEMERTEPSATEVAPPGGTETVLLVEDEEVVRGIAKTTLEMSGYTVIEASDPETATVVCEREGRIIHLLLTDVVMPHMSGRVLAERVATLRPQMKVLYMSGYTEDAIVQHGVLEKGINFIEKPFTPDALANKVREVLDAEE